MSSGRIKGPVCGVENCRSRLYDEGEDGFLYCQNGHRQGGLVRGEDDEDNYSTPAARAITRKKKDQDDEPKRVAKHLTGRRALDLYLKCLQLILRHQVWFLIQEKGLPAELETVVFDLWALHIAQLGDKIAGERQDADLQTQVFSTLESGDSENTDDDHASKSVSQRRDKKLLRAPNLYDCLALCYLGVTTLRLPITPGDMYAWVTDGKMAFRRAITLIPLVMRDRLPPSYHDVLDPQTMMSYKRFYRTLTSLSISYECDHGVLWPALNAPLLLFRYLKELALPLELYDATMRLRDLLGYDFAFTYNQRKQLGIRHLPEAQLVGCLTVCVKLFYPFDKIQRHPISAAEPTSTIINWKSWCTVMEESSSKRREGDFRLTTEELTQLQEKDAFELSPKQLDQYLDFYADTFLDAAEIQRTADNDDFRNALYGMFPIEGKEHHEPIQLSDELSEQDQLHTVRAVHGAMEVRAAVGEDEVDEVVRPGQMYQIWKTKEDLPERAKKFCDELGRIAGLPMDMMVLAVFFTEARVERWQRIQREGSRR